MAPVVSKGTTSRRLYLPRGVWHDYWTNERHEGGREIERAVDLETTPLYVRAGAIIPHDPVRQYTSQAVREPATFVIYPGADGRARLYEDDGISFDYRTGAWMGVDVAWNDSVRTLTLRLTTGSRVLPHPPVLSSRASPGQGRNRGCRFAVSLSRSACRLEMERIAAFQCSLASSARSLPSLFARGGRPDSRAFAPLARALPPGRLAPLAQGATVFSIALLFLALAVACSTPSTDVAIRVGTDVDASSLDPRLMRDTTSYRVVDLLYDGLVRLDRDLVPAPGLATSWENPEPTRWVFHLREDVRFHDGRPLVAEDVVHTLETLLDPAFGAPLRSLYEPISRVDATDAHTVEIHLEGPYAPLLSYLDVGIVPRESDNLETAPIGTGPYRLRRWERGSKIVLEANKDYWGGAPKNDRIEIVVVPDNTARAQAFEAGDLDLIQSPLSPQDIRRLSADPRFQGVRESGPSITYFNFNTSRAPLDEPGVRRAISMLIDQDTILSRIYEGGDEKARSVLLPSSWAFSSEIAQPTYDPEGAEALLDEIGFRDGDGDGVRERGAQKLAFELGTHGEDVNRVQTVEFLQNQWKSHGVEVRLRISDWPSFSVRRDASDFDVILLGWTQLVDPDKGLYDQFHSEGGLNWGRFRDPKVDALLSSARSTTDRKERASMYREIATILAAQVPYYVLSYQGYHLFHSARLRGFAADPRGMLRGLMD